MKSDVVYKKFADIVKINHREDQYLTIAPLNMTHTILIRFHLQITIQALLIWHILYLHSPINVAIVDYSMM